MDHFVEVNGKVDVLQAFCEAQMKRAMDAVTDELLADYIRNHALSRGAAVGQA